VSTVVIPGSGLVVALDGAPLELLDAWEHLTEIEQDLRTTKREIGDEITRRLDHEGRRSMVVDGVKFETTAPTEKVWDLVQLQETLDELTKEGTISAAKANACIKWEPKAAWMELKTLLSDPRCQARIANCFSEEPASRYGKVKRG
jgi:hypothetical protein